MTPRYAIAAIAAAGWLAAAPALAQTGDAPPKIDPQAVQIATDAAKFLTGQKAMSFDWFVSYDEVLEGREKITFLRSGTNIFVRGEGFAFATEDGGDTRDYYYDGKTFTIASTSEGFYASAPFDGGFEALLEALRERTGMDLPLWSLMSETLGEDAVGDLEGAAYLGTTLIAGHEVHHLAFSDYDEDWQLWVSTDPDQPVPLMMIGTNPYEQGWPQYRAHMLNWSFDVTAPEGGFVYTPAEDDIMVTMPALAPTEREKALEGARATGDGASSDN